ncbi:deoxyribose-phosphate aldolase [Sinanaerobacter chloroacetimidivorans]|uniref:Deoxyribose-phosphate aldolase n=1 Tax=Sinanaerobacter chloroacetimidivorans TaxID=2818044 RepID=A0A8J7W4L6_9FIRM|nr:deoxyribose-phosphate aldolase [Sinanaerobacter chloroacetimidivorans]MBR0599263.1 deoxyribose-phosphate aldolase [Sinanaerobacter chloroacetimidivorans]
MRPSKKASEMTVTELAKYIDYSVLKPEFTEQEIIDLTKDGVRLGCATICINPGYLDLCEPYVKGSETMLCPVCDFPFGTSSSESKVKQIEIAAKYDTVKEIDVVANFGWIRGGMYDKVTEDIKACADMAHQYGRKLKVIFETDALDEEQVRNACQCAVKAGADFVKTSTGFLTGFEAHGATPEIIKVMMEEVDGKCQVKGSGCIRTREHFLQLIDMGIDRMGVGYKSVPVVLDEKKESIMHDNY